MNKCLWVFLFLIVINKASASDLKTNSMSCLKHGESGSVGGVPGKSGWVLKPKCCKGLVDRESLAVCGKAYGGGYVYVCLKCGDGICDSKAESNCNCPEDCKK